MKILFFSRGRGRGHAIPDIAIANDLLCADATLSIQFVSYGTGAETIRQWNRDVIDLKLPDANSFLETLRRSTQIVNEFEPSMIIAHEEFCIPFVAKLFDIPCVFLTDWFPPEGSFLLESLTYADTVIFMDDAGYFDEPKPLAGRVQYVGPFIREMAWTRADKHTAREQLSIPYHCKLLLVLPGGATASSEESAPLFDLVTSAVKLLNADVVVLWVMGSEDERTLRHRRPIDSQTVIIPPQLDIAKAMVASDATITKATRKTSLELNALGIPSISISYGLNPIDDYRVPQIKTNRALRARGLTPVSLASHLGEVLNDGVPSGLVPENVARGRTATIYEIQRLISALSEE